MDKSVSFTKVSGRAFGPDKIWSEWIFVTPEMAAEFLTKNIRNRTLIKSVVEKYLTDLRHGYWSITHEGIAFDCNMNLIDGQHRLHAISMSGRALWMLATYNLPEQSVEVINRGKSRSLANALQIMGYSTNERFVAIARRMWCGCNFTFRQTDAATRRFIDLNFEALSFAASTCTKEVGPATVAAVFARAYYHFPVTKLERLPLAIMDRIDKDSMQPGDRSARAVRRMIEMVRFSGGGTGLARLYRKAQNGIYCALHGKDVERIFESSTDLFPLSQDKIPTCKEDD